MNKTEWTLSEVARLLHEPQHRLIYLCEKKVVIPDFSDAQGRGSSRRFSARNIFEFSVALLLSEFHFPANISANFLYAVRSFEASVKKNGMKDFSLPFSLMNASSPEITALICKGTILYFSLGLPGQLKQVFGGVDISEKGTGANHFAASGESNSVIDLTKKSNIARFEFNLTKTAQTLEIN